MKMLVQMMRRGGDVQFIGTTDADLDGSFWAVRWGDAIAGVIKIAYTSVAECDASFQNGITYGYAIDDNWECEGSPLVVYDKFFEEYDSNWIEWATKEIMNRVLSSTTPP